MKSRAHDARKHLGKVQRVTKHEVKAKQDNMFLFLIESAMKIEKLLKHERKESILNLSF